MERLSRAEAKARTRKRLLDAAVEVFAHKGFAGASVDEIAERAGYTVGALYSNFAGKEELFLSLLDDHLADHLRDIDRLLAAEPLPGKALGAYLVKVADGHGPWGLLEMEFLRHALTRPELRERLADRWRAARRAVARDVEAALPPVADSMAVATVMIALFDGLIAQRRIDPSAVPETLYGDALGWLAAGLTQGAEQ